jgi:protein gp37
MLNCWSHGGRCSNAPVNVWLGSSVENQATADERIPHLLGVPAAVRFLSVEPLLGPVEFWPEMFGNTGDSWCGPRVNWVIVGGESGPGSRPCDIAHIRSLVQQCKSAVVPCFVKQLGAHVIETREYGAGTGKVREGKRKWRPYEFVGGSESMTLKLRDSKGGDMSEWPEDLRVREMSEVTRA